MEEATNLRTEQKDSKLTTRNGSVTEDERLERKETFTATNPRNFRISLKKGESEFLPDVEKGHAMSDSVP